MRVRHFGTFAKIEVQKNDLAKLDTLKDFITNEIREIGFGKIEIDSEGLVSGKLNRVLNPTDMKKK